MSSLYTKLVQDPDEYYRKLFAVHWLDEWTDEEMQILHDALRRAHEEKPEYMVFVLSEYTLEPEGVSTAKQYKEELLRLFGAFGLELDAADVDVEDGEGAVEMFVGTPGGTVRWRFEQYDDWMSDDFLDFVNEELLPEWEEDRVFNPLPPASAKIELVFHYPEVVDEATDEGIIPDDDFFARRMDG